MAMRIGIITGEFPPMQGGVGDYSLELARHLAALGHEVCVLTDARATPVVQAPGITVQAAIQRWGRWGKRQRGQTRRGELEARAWAAASRPDVVTIQYQAAAYRMRLIANRLPELLRDSIPVVTTFHDLLVPYLFPKAGYLRKWAVYHMARASQGVIVTNRADELELAAAGQMPPVTRIPIGSNIAAQPPADFDRAVWRHTHGIPHDVFLVGFFGFINRSKGIDTLAHAVRILTERGLNPHLLVVGGQTGSSDHSNLQQADEAERLIGGLGIARRVHWTGFVEAEAVSAHLMSCDVVALPYKDGVSFRRGTLMAALAHGCPIVTTFPQVDEPDLKDGYAMRLVPPDSPQRLAVMLHELARDEAQRARLGTAAQTLSAQFRWETIAAQTAEFFHRLLAT